MAGQKLELPPTHVTLYAHGNPDGIGLPDGATWERLVKEQIDLQQILSQNR